MVTASTQRASLLDCQIQPYAWGSYESIAKLLGKPYPTAAPQAELWMGAHPKAPATLTDENITLDLWIQKDPQSILGKAASLNEGKLPYLLKILAAAAPLSIQAHPNKAQAVQGFAREEAAGVPFGAKHRNYKDANHKPELICALTPFWALKGFRAPEEIIGQFAKLGVESLQPLLRPLIQSDVGKALEGFFAGLMQVPADEQAKLAAEIRAQVAGASASETWEAAPILPWVERLGQTYPDDLSIIAPLYLHLHKLMPGEAFYLGAGELHAYLEGTGIELMANSDNVLRGGLTPKHIDVPELLSVLHFAPNPPKPLGTQATNQRQERLYITPAPEFALSHITLVVGDPYLSPPHRSAEILLCTEGSGTLDGPTPLSFAQGSVLFIPASHPPYQLTGNASIYKATTPE